MRVIDVLNSPWAIMPNRLIEINEIYARHLRGEKISRETIAMIEAQIGKPLDNKQAGYEVVNGVAILPLDGVLSKRMNMFTKISGGTSMEIFTRDLSAIQNDPNIKATIINADTPGGTVDGTQATANAVYAAGGKKPVVTFSGGLMASAGVWIGSAAQGGVYLGGDTVAVGSIGVVTSHTDYSKAEDMMGIKTTEITAGEYKRISSEHAPLSESGRAYIQAQLDHIYGVFLSEVGKHRGGQSADQVHERMANGRMFMGARAIDAGLADGFATLEELIATLAAGELPKRRTQSVSIAVPAAQTPAGVVEAEITAQEETTMDLKELKEKHADLYQAVFEEGKSAGLIEGTAAGSAAQLERIKSVKAVAMPGHEALLETLMFDGKTTGPEAAVMVINAENGKRAKHLEGFKADGKDVHVPVTDGTVVDAVAAAAQGAAEDKDLPVEERAKAAWDADGKLRGEFNGNYESFLSYYEANDNGQVKMLKKG